MIAPVYPHRDGVGLLICETVERDARGQLLVRGLFPACEIGASRYRLPDAADSAAVLEKLCFVFFVEGGEGEFEASLAIHATEGGVAFDEHVGRLSADRDGATVFVVRMAPFVLPRFGKHHVVLKLDDREYYATCCFVESDAEGEGEHEDEIEGYEFGVGPSPAAPPRRVLH